MLGSEFVAKDLGPHDLLCLASLWETPRDQAAGLLCLARAVYKNHSLTVDVTSPTWKQTSSLRGLQQCLQETLK